jgi:hypothetical protein
MASRCNIGKELSGKTGSMRRRLKQARHFRDEKWTESVAGGSRAFVTETREKLGVRTKGRQLVGTGESCEPRESPTPYKGISGYENKAVRGQHIYFERIPLE